MSDGSRSTVRKGQDLSGQIRRLEPIERQVGVELAAIGAHVTFDGGKESRYLTVAGELRSITNDVGMRLTIVATVYATGRVIATAQHDWRLDAPFETFSIPNHKLKLSPTPRPTKIVVFPKARM